MAMMPSPGRPPQHSAPEFGLPPTDSELELDRLRLWSAPPASGSQSSTAGLLESILEEFTRRWDRGEAPRTEQYLDRLPSGDPDAPLELIYHEYCLTASSGRRPPVDEFVDRFPEYRDRLLRLIALHEVLPSVGPEDEWPESPLKPGDEVGPYRLLRELGRGGFARVYLAADAELEDRLLVVKVTDRPSAEHRYLARAPHPHIVPILRERTTDDGLQLIFMPFVGGATLGDVLAEARLRSRQPDRGLDLLADLDLCSAPEYSAATPVRPAREILGTLTYPEAIAWIVARLAEALDHAYRRGVTHGDLKPSNILIGGDGQPMLLDFNLSTDWQPASSSRTSGELGGTLAYMAPERLRSIAEPELSSPPCPSTRHRADVYALGLILREALTGAPPSVPMLDNSPRKGREVAARLAAERSAGDPSSRSQLASIPPGLRAILRRCLAPDPADRYPLASQLAADLDSWRSGLPLIHTTPPIWVEGLRWLRYHQRPLIAASLCVLLGLLATGAASRVQDQSARFQGQINEQRLELRSKDHAAIDALWTDPESGAYGYWNYRANQLGTRMASADYAERILTTYGFFEADDDDFWSLDRVAHLDEPDRSDLRAWVIEQALLYGIEATRPHYNLFPEDRQAALNVLDRLLRHRRIEPLDDVARLLRTQLGLSSAAPQPPTAAESIPGWLESYLLGVRAEALRLDDAKALAINPRSIGYASAISHYKATLADRPDLYWPRYRLAASSYTIGHFDVARASYAACLDRRPQSAALWLGIGSCEVYQGASEQALSSLQEAIRHAPRWETAWRNLALLGTRLEDRTLVEEAIRRFQIKGRNPRSENWHQLKMDLSLLHPGMATLASGVDEAEVSNLLLREAQDDRADLGLRYSVARRLQQQGNDQDAFDHYSRILEDDPAHLKARFNRAIALQRLGRKAEALDDYQVISESPNVSEFIEGEPTGLMSMVLVSGKHALLGQAEPAIRLAQEALAYSQDVGRFEGESYYCLARAYSVAAQTDPTRLKDAAEALSAARELHEGFIEATFHADPLFDPHRAEIASLIGGVEF